MKFAHICPKQALKYTIFVNIQKRQKKMAKWPNHFISGKRFQKRPNGNPDASVLTQSTQAHTS